MIDGCLKYRRIAPVITMINEPIKMVKSKGYSAVMVWLMKAGRIYIFQTVWGLHTNNFFGQKGRAIIGSTIIAPADLGIDDMNVKKTWLDRMDRMAFSYK